MTDTVQKIVLASASPRRRELLSMFGVPFDVCPAKGEEVIPPELSPAEVVMALAKAKASEVAAKYSPDAVVIGSDTIVALDGKLLGKPKDAEAAAAMLRALSGREHHVFSGVCVLQGDTVLTDCGDTLVHFRALEEEEIAAYIRTGEPMDKAGAYGYQGLASLFIDRIDGDFFNVMGLPLCLLGTMLKKIGVSLL